MFEFPSALIIISSNSATSGHLITDPIWDIALIAASCTFSWVSLRTSLKALTMSGKKTKIYLGAQSAMFPIASTAANLPLQLSEFKPSKYIGTIYLIARLVKLLIIYWLAEFAASLTGSLGSEILFIIFGRISLTNGSNDLPKEKESVS